MEFWIKAAQLILSLSILVVLHELGHYIAARVFKCRVEKFYLFFNPWFSLYKKKVGDTEYGIGWLPLGGYVKISGMLDESMDKEQMKLPPQPHEFRSKPAWQRLIIMLGGIIVNVILGIFIYSMILLAVGEKYIPTKNLKYGIVADSLAQKAGFKNGDKILAVDGRPVERFEKLSGEIIINNAKVVSIERDGKNTTVNLTEENIKSFIDNEDGAFLDARVPFIIDSVLADSGASKAKLKKGDMILAINDSSIHYLDEAKEIFQKNKNKTVTVVYERNKMLDTVDVLVSKRGMIGTLNVGADKILGYDSITYGIISCFPAGANKAWSTVKSYVKQFGLIFNSKIQGYKHLGGFMSIGKSFAPTWDWLLFWQFTAFLSIVLAFMNLLPIPALDGGHVMFTLYEMITRRKPNEKFLEYAQMGGMILLLGLMLFANGNDLVKHFFK